MKSYKLWLLDLDGTMYRGTEKIEEAPMFIEQLKQAGTQFKFITNNSSKTPEDVVAHLQSFGINVQADQIYTSSMATARFVTEQKQQPLVYMIGEKGLRSALEEAGCQIITETEARAGCDYVVMGIDRHITYEKMATASLAIRNGASFVSTNADKALPTEKGLVPGNGALTSVIMQATGVDPTWIGKPESWMVDFILKEEPLDKQDTLIIGDNYETDILTGIRAGVDTAIVFTGFSSPEDLKKVETLPTYQWQTLLDYKNDIALI